MFFVSSWISTYWEIAREVEDKTGARSGDIDRDRLGVFFSLSGISTCSGDLELNRSVVIFSSLSFGILIGRSWDRSRDLEFSYDLNREIGRATGSSIRRP